MRGLFLAAIALTACQASQSEFTANDAPASAIIAEADISPDVADWGNFYAHFTEDTHALSPVLVGTAKIKAGQQIHPPHRHADEEYLMVTRGRGFWSLNGDETPAAEGDILFARAWDYHGVRAAEDSPLEFVVFKYSGRGVSVPTDPDPTLPNEQTD